MTDTLLLGITAGLALSLPVGTVAVLVAELAVRRGLAVGVGGVFGATVAVAVVGWATAGAGAAIVDAARPLGGPIRILAAGVLVGIAINGALRLMLGTRGAPGSSSLGDGLVAAFLRTFAVALLRPVTVLYLAAIGLGLPALVGEPWAPEPFAAALIATVGVWWLGLALAGALAHRRPGRRFQLAAGVAGNGLILGLAGVLATGA